METRKEICLHVFKTTWSGSDNVIISLYEDDWQYGVVEVHIYKQDRKGEALIWNLFVDGKKRSKGYGQKLLDAAINVAIANNCTTATVEWDGNDSDQWVLEWYTRQGFDETDFGEDYCKLVKDLRQ